MDADRTISEQLRERADHEVNTVPFLGGVSKERALMLEAADEIDRLGDIVRQVPGFCLVCTTRIEDYAHKYELHGPMADFCSQECFDRGTVKGGR